MSRNTFLFSALWVALILIVYYLADNIQNPNKAWRLGDNANIVTLKRGLDGHYRAEALINNEKVDVLVDTGATGVARMGCAISDASALTGSDNRAIGSLARSHRGAPLWTGG